MSYKIYLYDTDTDCIGSGTLSSSYIQWQLEAAAGQDVEVHISSAGGSAFDAIAIYDLFKKYPGNITTYIDALAASAASIIAMGGQNIVMSKYALLMIHKPMVGSGGNSDELLKDVQMLNVVQSYRNPTYKMKIYSLLIAALILSACAKKTYTLDGSQASNRSKLSTDSIGQKKTIIKDKSYTITTKSIDTSILVMGKPLLGTIRQDINSTHFENEDIILDMYSNRYTGKISAVAKPKNKTIPFHYQEKIITNNDILKTEELGSYLKVKRQINVDSSNKHVINNKESFIPNFLRKSTIWILLSILFGGLVLYVLYKFNVATFLKSLFMLFK